ncbi:MAG: acylneuraminate cytidylyltransferase family protein [Chitinophagales bacterium]|jgi:N-acylneuraminate cytidylyltransferase|nr:acylneuraminate cytidylyltransferase family protein [Bacteroidota bacterium]MBP8917301.1 acylneuraminate cytidylyltransferase family protein [Chitinophagales bacterium]MBP9221823.1 acylneuraminate cytidylyltransferase family protein [Chitinophagales bacterium]MBP9796505.1 acylneuraminate cytidylyltransferase family protein [Chitinophagales bacterium]
MKILAIIPARSGSKGLPGKNIKPLLQHPLLAYSILAAQQSKLINRITVNTDSDQIAEIAKQYNAEIPFMRPAELAQDLSTDLDVFKHQLEWMKNTEGYVPDIVVQLRPTSPVRFANWIDEAIEKLISSDADSIRVVTESPLTPFKMWLINNNNDGAMEPLVSVKNIIEPYNQPRQSLPIVYWQIGTLDVIKTKTILEGGSMSGKKILSYIVDKKYAIDIDDVASFYKAEELIQYNECIKFDE